MTSDMLSEAAKELAYYGLTYKEALVYLNLLTKNGCKASELAEGMEMQRTAVYEILNELQGRAIVRRTLERPFRYYAVPIKSVVDAHLTEYSRQLREKELKKSSLLASLESLPIEKPADTDFFQVVQDRDAIYDKIKELCGEAEKEIFIASNHPLSVIIRYDIDSVCKRVVSKGVKVKLLSNLQHSEISLIKEVSKICEIRHLPILNSDFFIIDKHVVMLVRNSSLPPFKETAIWVNSTSFRETIVALFNEWWSRSEGAMQYVLEQKKAVAHNEVFSCLNYECIKPFALRMYSSAKEEIFLVGLNEKFFRHPAEKEGQEIIKQKSLNKKITVQVLARLSKDTYPELVELSKYAEVRVTSFPVVATVDIVDRNEVLIQDLTDLIGEGAYLATWMRSPSVAASFRHLFDYVWDHSKPFGEGMQPS